MATKDSTSARQNESHGYASALFYHIGTSLLKRNDFALSGVTPMRMRFPVESLWGFFLVSPHHHVSPDLLIRNQFILKEQSDLILKISQCLLSVISFYCFIRHYNRTPHVIPWNEEKCAHYCSQRGLFTHKFPRERCICWQILYFILFLNKSLPHNSTNAESCYVPFFSKDNFLFFKMKH